MNIKKINFNKIKYQSKKILNILAKKAGLFFLFLIILYLILGGILIYKYSVLAQRTEIYTTEKKENILKKNAYQKILEHWDAQKIKFNEIDKIIYPDPFIEKTRHELSAQQPAEANDALFPAAPPSEEDKIKKETAQIKEKTQENDLEPIAKSFFGKINTLFNYYVSQGKNLLSIDERAKIWEQEGLGETEEYHGFYNQNINLLEQLTK